MHFQLAVMNAGSFLKYINTPSLLHQLSYEELKTIVLQYPYNANLHLLLLLKSKLENHKEYEKNLAMAASHSIDRAYLYKLLQDESLVALDRSSILHEEDILELKDLKSVEAELEKTPILLAEAPEIKEENINYLELSEQKEKREESKPGEPDISAEPELPNASVEREPEVDQPADPLLSQMNALNDLIEDVIAQEEKSPGVTGDEISELSNLTNAIKDFLPEEEVEESKIEEPKSEQEEANSLSENPQEKPEPELKSKPEEKPVDDTIPKKPSVKKRKKKKVAEIASKSIKSQSRVASETLAQLLEKQGLTEKAIKMYEQLILTFPEKSAYFAAKIENLKNLK